MLIPDSARYNGVIARQASRSIMLKDKKKTHLQDVIVKNRRILLHLEIRFNLISWIMTLRIIVDMTSLAVVYDKYCSDYDVVNH